METNVTRRRVMQGAGAIGVASLTGNVVAAAGGGGSSAQSGGTAIRVVHASPDTPTIQASLSQAGSTGDMGGTGTPDEQVTTDGGVGATTTAEQTTTGGETATPGGDGPLVEGLEFSQVSSYQEVEPGTYQLQITATESSGLLDDIFGGDQQERVVLTQQIEISEGTTYTAVAYGQLAQTEGLGEGSTSGASGTTGDTSDGGISGGDTSGDVSGGSAQEGNVLIDQLAYGESASFVAPAQDMTLEFRETNSSGTGGDTATGSTQQSNRGLALALLEDDLSAPSSGGDTGTTTESDEAIGGTETTAEGTETTTTGTDSGQTGQARMRVFHAVPDVNTMQVVAVQDDGQSGTTAENTTTQNESGGGLLGGGDGQNETTTEPSGGMTGSSQEEQSGGGVKQAQVSLESGVVYSGFAMGYFDPQSASQGGATGSGNVTTTESDGNESGSGGILGGGDAQNETTGTPSGGGIAESSEAEEFQFVTVETARDGERVDDGGSDGGLF